MRKFILLIILINLHIAAYNQVIKGTIKDKQTDSTILFASIYFNGTFVGTASDQDGNFEFDISKYSSMPITISSVGYYSITLDKYSINQPNIIYLTPKVFELKETIIKDKSLVRKRKIYLRMFKHVFLGTTQNARSCEILNETDISFNYNSDKDTLKVFASKPLIIHNKALGYKITYFLDKFEYEKRSGNAVFYGNILFTENSSIEKTGIDSNERKRMEAYFGSRMHFFRSLWLDDLKSNMYKVIVPRSVNTTVLAYEQIVFQDANKNKFLEYFNDLEIIYFSSLSYITFLKPLVYFEKNGYFDPLGIEWKGEMSMQRVGDWLPYEYSIED